MRRHQTEAAYLKSVLLWLQGNWTEPDPPRFYPLKEVDQGSRFCSVRRNSSCSKSTRRENRSTRVLATQKPVNTLKGWISPQVNQIPP